MASESEVDDLLAAFENDQDDEYEMDLESQDPIDMDGIEESDENTMTIEIEDHDVPPGSVNQVSPKESSTATVVSLPDDEGVINVEDYSPRTTELPAPIMIKDENVASDNSMTGVIKIEEDDSDVEILWPELENHVIDITDSDDDQDVIDVDEDTKVHVKMEPLQVPFEWTDMGERTIDLSESDAESGHGTKVKSEDSNTSFTWTPMTEHTIQIHDSDSEERVNEPISAQQNPEIRQTVKLGTSMFQNQGSQVQISLMKLKEAQQNYAKKQLGNPTRTGAGSIFHSFQGPLDRSDLRAEGSAAGLDFAGEEADRFRALKIAYKAKEKAGKNSEEDDILFMAAEKKEKARVKKLMAEYYRTSGLAGSEDDEDEAMLDDDERLFAARFMGTASASKRHRTATDEAGSDDAASGEENEPAAGKRSRSNQTDRRAYLKELKQEERWNMMTGCEKMIYDEQKKEEREAKKAEKEVTKNQKKGKHQKAKKHVRAAKAASKIKKPHTTQRKRNKMKLPKLNPSRENYLMELGNLRPSNVYDVANANIGKKQLATSNARNKKEALAGLLAGIDNDDLPSAQREKNNLDRAMKTLGKYRVKADGEGGWRLKGMLCSLHHYQVQGSAFMKERETGDLQPRGGLLADQMGLGKTVTAIAAMIANRPALGSETKCTLIVATPAIVTQWISELQKHVEPDILEVIIRHTGSNKIAGPGAITVLKRADVVMTTYNELLASYPKCEPPPELVTLEEKKQWWYNVWDQQRGPLHRVFFHRVILDEAQAIKNHMSQTSIACRALMARHRWALTGTPIHNRVSETYPYFRYLRVKHTGSFQVFKHNFCVEDDETCTERLHAYLRQFMLRRTHQSEFMGAPLLTLPRNSQRTLTVEFSPIERTLYDDLRMKYVRQINSFARQGDLEGRTSYILTLCLRLRQLTAHPFLIQDVIQELFTLEDIEKLWTLSSPEIVPGNKRGKELYTAMKNMIEDKTHGTEDDQPAAEEGIDDSKNQNEPGLELRFRKYLRSLNNSRQWTDLKQRSLCNKCNSPPDDPWVTSCFHMYCKECLNHMAYEASRNHETQTECLQCGEPFSESQPCNGIEEIEMEEIAPSGRTVGKNRQRRKRYQDNAVRWLDLEGDVLQSSKTTAVKMQLEAWLKEEPDKKIIVFSQFLLLMKVVARICEQNDWGYCNYNGNMSHDSRDESLETFRDDTDKKILIASLKCGGIGLNLTMASKVICVDLWWNSCVEQQAFCRVFRIGQESETHITRLVVKDTIDERLMEMQKEKEEVIGRAIDDNNKMLKQLATHDLMRLFGPVGEDEHGRPFILVDDDELGTIEPSTEQPARPKKQAKGAKKGKKPGRPKKAEAQQKSQPEADTSNDVHDSDGNLFVS